MTSIFKQILKQQNIAGLLFGYKDNIRLKKSLKQISSYTKTGERVLDIGCADGYFTVELLKAGYDCYGLEVDINAARDARQKGIKVICKSFLEELPYESRFFDTVYAGEVIEHTIDDRAFLKEMHRVLKPKGHLILTTPNLLSLTSRLFMLFGLMPPHPYKESHYKYYNLQIILQKLIQSGFKIEKVESSYLFISNYYINFAGKLTEWLGSLFPKYGENFIICAKRK